MKLIVFHTIPVNALDIFIPEGNPGTTLEGMLQGTRGIAVDHDGNVWVADTQNHVVRKYFSDGTPLTVLGRESVGGFQEGSPVDVRFSLPFRLAIDAEGNILVADGSHLIRQINGSTLFTRTVADLSFGVDCSHMLSATDITTTLIGLDDTANIDVSNVYNITSGFFENLVDNPLCDFMACDFGVNEVFDVAGAPNGDILIGASRGYGLQVDPFHYILRHGPAGTYALARAQITYGQTDLDRQARGIACDTAGNFYAAFPEGSIIADHDALYRFPAGFPAGGGALVQPVFDPLMKSDGLVIDRQNRLYLTQQARNGQPAKINIVSTTLNNTVLQILKKRLLNQVHDIAMDAHDNVYVTSTETRHFGNVPYTVARVTRYPELLSSQLPLDSDNDGIVEYRDKCPDTPAGEKIDIYGCSAFQRDSDKDGVFDGNDQCPNTLPGKLVDDNGCEIIKGDISKDGKLNLEDSLIGLKVISAYQTSAGVSAEVDEDGKIGVSDSLYILQELLK